MSHLDTKMTPISRIVIISIKYGCLTLKMHEFFFEKITDSQEGFSRILRKNEKSHTYIS